MKEYRSLTNKNPIVNAQNMRDVWRGDGKREQKTRITIIISNHTLARTRNGNNVTECE